MNKELYLKAIGQSIRKIRKDNNLSQEALSEKIMIAQSTLAYIEKGTKSTTIETLLIICDGLSISLLDLLMMDDKLKNDVDLQQKVKSLLLIKNTNLEEYNLTIDEDFEKYISEVRPKK